MTLKTTFILMLLVAFAPIISSAQGTPPGTVNWKENIYVDQYEIRNIDYREFLYWQKRTVGKESSEYKILLPDTTLWNSDIKLWNANYFRQPKYREYPIVGLTWKQAMAYTKWRTDRVNEDYYLRHGLVTKENVTDAQKLPAIYNYRLPNLAEWTALNEIEYSKKQLKKIPAIGKINSVKDGAKNKLKIYQLNSGVSEMINAPDYAMGNNWKDDNSEMERKYTKPENWVGFRCICEVVNPKE